MPLGPFDEFLAHQTSETFDHVAHVGSQLLRPVLLQHALEQRRAVRDHRSRAVPQPRCHRRVHHRVDRHRAAHGARVARARRRPHGHLGRTAVGRGARGSPEVARAVRRERVGHQRRPDVHRHRRRARGAAHVHPSLRPRDPGRHPLRAGRRVGRHHHRRRSHVRRDPRRVEGRARPLVGRASRRRARAARHPGARRAGRLRLPARLAADAVRRPHAQGADRPGRRRRAPRRGVDAGVELRPRARRTGRAPRSSRGRHRLPARHARDARRHGDRPDGRRERRHHHRAQHAAAHAVPRRRFGLREPRRLGPRRATRAS